MAKLIHQGLHTLSSLEQLSTFLGEEHCDRDGDDEPDEYDEHDDLLCMSLVDRAGECDC